jgi:hypothetical protein
MKLQVVDIATQQKAPFRPDLAQANSSHADSEISNLKGGAIHLATGDNSLVEHFLYETVIRSTLQPGKIAVFVDCKNSFNSYAIAGLCRGVGLDEKKVLQSIWISRPFTAYQLNTLVDSGLDEILGKEPSLVVFSGLLDLFTSEDVEERDSKVILNRVLADLREMSNSAFPLLLTHTSAKRKNLRRLEVISNTQYTFCAEKNKAQLSISDAQTVLSDYLGGVR